MIKFILLGIVQGLTEFLPVSSSGHLVIFQHVFGINKNVVFLDLVLHLGTLCSLLVFFRKDIFVLIYNFFIGVNDIIFHKRLPYILKYDDKFKLCIHIIVITIVTGLIGLYRKDFFERQFINLNTVIFSLLMMSVILFLTKNFIYGQRRLRHVSLKDSILFGFVQSLAIIPGISRSGITISTLLFRNFDRESAFKISFLASIPIIFAAFIFKLKEIGSAAKDIPLPYLISGFLFAFLSGLVALYILRLILKQKSFYKFSYYCFLLSVLILLLRLKNIL
ncbi:MAG: undecaprenyl-diphosphate phosphatase [Candidatus Omnitrophota bacterium]